MKIIKEKEVITEEIDLELGTYYYKCNYDMYHKMILEDYDNGEGVKYFLESVENSNNDYSVRVRKDTISIKEELPYKFTGFILGISGKEISAKK